MIRKDKLILPTSTQVRKKGNANYNPISNLNSREKSLKSLITGDTILTKRRDRIEAAISTHIYSLKNNSTNKTSGCPGGNLRVALRTRPLLEQEIESGCFNGIYVAQSGETYIYHPISGT
jgi:hypothetical protein